MNIYTLSLFLLNSDFARINNKHETVLWMSGTKLSRDYSYTFDIGRGEHIRALVRVPQGMIIQKKDELSEEIR